ncbi:MAG: FGGY-family carbohydrate kinase, partial [Brachymonas sp.]|nr:FGGY-family carbohydrate kinase [Brachymonas sp.]
DALGSGLLPDLGMLPQLGFSDALAGHITAEAAQQCGLAEGTPVAVGAVDALSEAISVGAVNTGDLMLMYGSTAFFVLVQDQPTPDPTVWSVTGAFAGQHNLAAGMATTGSLTRWFCDEMARDLGDQAYATLFAQAAQVDPGAHGLLVLPYFSGERTPINDPQARGVIAGLNLSHERKHLFRALLEGVGLGIRHNLETFTRMGAQVQRMVAVGGGAQTDVWLQIVSDIAGQEQIVPKVTIGASYGNAFLAGRAAGVLQADAIQQWIKHDRVIYPNKQHKATYDALFKQYQALYRDTRDVVHHLATLT